MDVVIIGGGPAGITAGTILQKKGYKTCIIDSETFPREKLCAGVLTKKTQKNIHSIYNWNNLKNISWNVIDKISLYYNENKIGDYSVNNSFVVINRMEFDASLLECYKRLNGCVYDGEKNYKIIYDKNLIILDNGKKISYKYIIGADGINSRVRNYVDKTWKFSILCYEKFINNISKEKNIIINFGNVIGGYSWRIPGKERIGVGIGELYIKGTKRNIEKYKKYFETQGVCKINNINGAFVSSGKYVRTPIRKNVILVGDAAGLVDAMTGEGIYFAIESGKQAALAIIDNIKRKTKLINYKKRLRYVYGKMNEQNIYNKLLYCPIIRKIPMKHMKENPKFVQHVLDNVISTYKSSYLNEIIKS